MGRDDACGPGVVSCHHRHLDTRAVAVADGRRHFGPHRILHADETEKDQIDQMAMAILAIEFGGDLALGKPEDAQSPCGQFLLLTQERPALDGADPVARIHAVGHRNQGFRRSLDEDAHRRPFRVERGRVSPVRLVRNAPGQGIAPVKLLLRDAALACGRQQRHVDGVAGRHPATAFPDETRLVRQRRRPKKRRDAGPRLLRAAMHAPDRTGIEVLSRLAASSVPSGRQISVTVSSFSVSVPVLSVAIIVQEPSDSTAGILRTMTWAPAILRMPIARATEMATGSPSGIALTASATDIMKRSWIPIPRNSPAPIRSATATPTAMAIMRANRSIRIIRGGCDSDRLPICSAILPISVATPVAVTTPRPRPRVIVDPADIRACRRSIVPSSVGADAAFLTAIDSPVSRDSSHCRSALSPSWRSAGTRPPASSRTISPGTRSRASTSRGSPSRITDARGCSSLRSAAAAWPAVDSWGAPMIPLTRSTAPMNTASLMSPKASDTTAAASRM